MKGKLMLATLVATVASLALVGGGANHASLIPVSAIAPGAYHACAVNSSGGLKCWGANTDGELGNGSTSDSLTGVRVSLPASVAEAGASYDRTCALLTDSKIYCWGRVAYLNANGSPQTSKKPYLVSGTPSGAHGLSVGVKHTCVLDTSNYVWCWGVNDRGQIGDGTTKFKIKPIKTKSAPASKITVSDGYTCALLVAGGVSCWGKSHGTDNDPNNPEGLVVSSNTPVTIAGLSTAVQIIGTGDFACARLSNDTVKCWGENDHGQLGQNNRVGSATPLLITLTGAVSDVVATANHACAIVTGNVYCWGRNDHGQMGDGSISGDHLVPGQVPNLTDITKLYGASSGHYTFAKSSNRVWSWGRNQQGALFDGTTNDRLYPVAVTPPL
jgi:alpha-tubulin suppressor-like RCC1 family protein